MAAGLASVCLLAAAQTACKSTPKSSADDKGGSPNPPSQAAPDADTHPPSSSSSPQTWESLCAAVEGAKFPESDAAGPAEIGSLKPGDSIRYYYGIDVPVDYARARQAAFMERTQGDDAFSASTVLMMLYANALGVERKIDLAIKLACEGAEGQAPAEIRGRVAHLDSMRTAPRGNPFDYCDDVSGGEMEGYCALLAEERRDAERKRRLGALSQSWSAEQRVALDRVRDAAEKLAELHATKEHDHSAMDKGMVIAEAKAAIRQVLLDGIEKCEQADFPKSSQDDYRAADAELNRVYKETLARDFTGTTITSAGIKTTEKAWILYRDAWLTLIALRYKAIDQTTFKTWLTRRRTEQLQRL